MRERLTTTTLYLAAWRLVGLLPEALAYRLFTLIADLAWWRRGRGVRRLEANLARVAPGADPRALSRRGMRSYLRYWCDAFRLPGWSSERIVSTCRVVDEPTLRKAFGEGRGLVCALAHQGNWDHAGAWSSLELAPVTTVAERLRPERVYEEFVRFRGRLGIEILPLTGGGNVFTQLVRRVKGGGVVPLLCDRDLTDSGVPVKFFGEQARMAGGPAMLALVTGAPLLPVTVHYEKLSRTAGGPAWGTVLHIHPPVPVPEGPRAEQVAVMTQAVADALAEGIRQHPEDWHMLQRVFDE